VKKRVLATGAKIPVRRNDQTFSRRSQNHQTLFRTKEQDPSTQSRCSFSHGCQNSASTRSTNSIQFGNCLLCRSASASFRKRAEIEQIIFLHESRFPCASNEPGARQKPFLSVENHQFFQKSIVFICTTRYPIYVRYFGNCGSCWKMRRAPPLSKTKTLPPTECKITRVGHFYFCFSEFPSLLLMLFFLFLLSIFLD